jgi:small conductance mechanosensitive channel
VILAAASLSDACGPDPGRICEWVFDATDSQRTAEVVDWLVHSPFRIFVIVLFAWLLNRLVRRGIRQMLERAARPVDEALRASNRETDRLWLERLRERNERSRQRALTMGTVLRSIASFIIYGLAGLMCLSEFGIDLAPLIAGAGIAGIAVGFGAQSLVRDFLAGVFIVIEDQYGVGDTVDLGDAVGSVEKVTLRTTWIRDLEGTLWVVPNGEIRRVANKSQRWARAVLDVRVAVDADLDEVTHVIRDAAQVAFDHQGEPALMLDPPEILGVESLVDGAAVIRVTVKTEPGAQFTVSRALRGRLKQAFDAAGIQGMTGVSTAPPPKKAPPR